MQQPGIVGFPPGDRFTPMFGNSIDMPSFLAVFAHSRGCGLAEVPAERRVLITAHDAFNSFGQAYGFEVRGLQGISTAAEKYALTR